MTNDIISNLTVSMTLDDATELATAVKALEIRAKNAEDALGRERADFEAYRNAEIERNANVQKRDEETLQQRLAVLAKNERKQNALEDYLAAKSHYVSIIYATVEKRLTRTERELMNAEKRKFDEAWEKFDKVQKEVTK